MSPLATFHRIAEALKRRPFEFLPHEERVTLAQDTAQAIETLQAVLTANQLQEGLAFKQLQLLSAAVHDGAIDEVAFLPSLRTLLAMYRLTTLPPDTEALLGKAASSTAKAEENVLEYHLALESLAAKTRGMAEDQRRAHENEVLREMGMFYVLEYTLQIQYECAHRTEEEQCKLLFEGMKVPAGNLPSLRESEPALKKELCYNLIDPMLREELIKQFFALEDALVTQDRAAILSSLRTFNIALVILLQKNGVDVFQGRLLTPYGNNLPMVELVQRISAK